MVWFIKHQKTVEKCPSPYPRAQGAIINIFCPIKSPRVRFFSMNGHFVSLRQLILCVLFSFFFLFLLLFGLDYVCGC